MGLSEYQRYTIKERRTVLEVLNDFFPGNQKADIPLNYLIQLIGKQKTKEYSISSGHSDKNQVDLTMAVVEYTTQYKRSKEGVCTGWLREMHNDPVPIWLKRGSFRLP